MEFGEKLIKFFKNRKIIFGIGFEIVLLAALMYIPFLQLIFNTGPLGYREWLMLFLIPIPIVAIEELRKYIVRKRNLRKEVV